MALINRQWTRVAIRLAHAPISKRDRDDRGDVPGWVMITLMTAALVVALLSVARPELKSMLSSALDSVSR